MSTLCCMITKGQACKHVYCAVLGGQSHFNHAGTTSTKHQPWQYKTASGGQHARARRLYPPLLGEVYPPQCVSSVVCSPLHYHPADIRLKAHLSLLLYLQCQTCCCSLGGVDCWCNSRFNSLACTGHVSHTCNHLQQEYCQDARDAKCIAPGTRVHACALKVCMYNSSHTYACSACLRTSQDHLHMHPLSSTTQPRPHHTTAHQGHTTPHHTHSSSYHRCVAVCTWSIHQHVCIL